LFANTVTVNKQLVEILNLKVAIDRFFLTLFSIKNTIKLEALFIDHDHILLIFAVLVKIIKLDISAT
jgi:hypothetical protein